LDGTINWKRVLARSTTQEWSNPQCMPGLLSPTLFRWKHTLMLHSFEMAANALLKEMLRNGVPLKVVPPTIQH
jgi:hypothetical protein